MRVKLLLVFLISILTFTGCYGVRINVHPKRDGEFQVSLDGDNKNLKPLNKVEITKFKEDKVSEKSLKAELNIYAGNLTVAGSSESLIDATAEYNYLEFLPVFQDLSTDSQGHFVMEQKEKELFFVRLPKRYINNWEVNLCKDIPLDLDINTGVSKATINLSETQVQKLIMKSGAGEVDLTVDGNYKEKITIDIDGGVGEFKANLNGVYQEDVELDFKAGVGELDLDLNGDYQQCLDANIQAGVGAVTIKLPRNKGIKINVEKGLGEINFKSKDEFTMTKRNGIQVYTNEDYQEDDAMMIEIAAGVGSVTIEQ